MTSTDDRLDLDAIRARADAASPGPWTIENGSIVHAGPSESRSNERWGMFVVASVGAHDIGRPGPANTAFIAHARTDVPALLAEVERLTAENTRLTRVVGNVMAGIKCPHRGGLCRLPKDHPGACQPTDAEERLVS